MNANRRQFLTGMAAVLLAGPTTVAPTRFIPKIECNGIPSWPFTYSNFMAICDQLVDKISVLGPLNDEEQEYVSACIDDVMWERKPIGLLVLWEITPERLRAKQWEIRELNFGTIVIS
jgi:hypothetical protein